MTDLQTSDYSVALAEGVRLQVRHLRHTRPNTGSRHTWMLLHESLGNIALWKRFPEQLAEATGADVLLYNRRGYGSSTDAPQPRPDDYLAEEGEVWLPRLLEALDLRDVLLLGHSDGASIALIGAAAAPGRVKGVISVAAHTFVDSLTVDGISEAVQRYRTTDLPERLAQYHGDRTDRIFNAWHETWLRKSFARSLNFSPWLPAIRCPALIVQGEQDEYGLAEQVGVIVEGIRAGRPDGAAVKGVFMPDTGHVPHLQQPEALLDLVGEFMGELEVKQAPSQA